jgi:hypothetical protein
MFTSNRYLTQYFATRRRLKLGLVIAGATSGAIAGASLTVLGKVVAGAPPATLANPVWNMATFGLIAAASSPIITWSALRRVQLWRTMLEPLVGGIAAASVGVLIGSGVAFLLLTPLGIGAAVLRLRYSYRVKRPAMLLHDGDAA